MISFDYFPKPLKIKIFNECDNKTLANSAASNKENNKIIIDIIQSRLNTFIKAAINPKITLSDHKKKPITIIKIPRDIRPSKSDSSLGRDPFSELGYFKDTVVSLTISGLNLNALPSSIKKMTNLTNLDLSENQLEVIPEPLHDLAKLKKLNLEKNPIKKVPENISNIVIFSKENVRYSPPIIDRPGSPLLKKDSKHEPTQEELNKLKNRIAELTSFIKENNFIREE